MSDVSTSGHARLLACVEAAVSPLLGGGGRSPLVSVAATTPPIVGLGIAGACGKHEHV